MFRRSRRRVKAPLAIMIFFSGFLGSFAILSSDASERLAVSGCPGKTLGVSPSKSIAAESKTAVKGSGDSGAMFPGANSRQPFSVEADKLNYYDKEQKAIYTGNVVLSQGDIRMESSVMTVYMTKGGTPVGGDSCDGIPVDSALEVGSGSSGVRHMDAVGPVTIVSKTGVSKSDFATYDKAEAKMRLLGHVSLVEGGNLTRGETLTYELSSGKTTIDGMSVAHGHPRVRSIFISSSNSRKDQ